MDINGIVVAILELPADELELVFEAAHIRAEQLRADKVAENFATLEPGMRVEITGNIRPKYLLGITGKVVAAPTRRTGDIMVEVDNYWRGAAPRYINRTTGWIPVPANCLRKVG